MPDAKRGFANFLNSGHTTFSNEVTQAGRVRTSRTVRAMIIFMGKIPITGTGPAHPESVGEVMKFLISKISECKKSPPN